MRCRSPVFVWVFLVAMESAWAQQIDMIVETPRTSRSVFTNWEEIEVVYTLKYLSDCEPVFDDAKPENMSFGNLEIDPLKGKKLIRRNERTFKNEKYVDLVYYLRHIGEKKGPIEISEQTFKCQKREGSQLLVGHEPKIAKAPGIVFVYLSVLPPEANDIKDIMDFGSFQGYARMWKGFAVVGFTFYYGLTMLFLFRKPVGYKVNIAGRVRSQMLDGQTAEDVRLAPREALELFEMELRGVSVIVDTHKKLAVLYEASLDLLLAFVPALSASDTVKQMQEKVLAVQPIRARQLLLDIAKRMEAYENDLYSASVFVYPDREVAQLRESAGELRPYRIWLFGLRADIQWYRERIKGLANRVVRLGRRPR